MPKEEHDVSTMHLFCSKEHAKKNNHHIHIPEANRGYQLLAKMGFQVGHRRA